VISLSSVPLGIFEFYFGFTFYQKSIEDKLSDFSREKGAIKEEIKRISPELKKVTLAIPLFIHSSILVYRTCYLLFMCCS
jgi:hypothetical protein